jgi:hypothetical protein
MLFRQHCNIHSIDRTLRDRYSGPKMVSIQRTSRGVIHCLEIEECCNDVFATHKRFANESFQTQQLLGGTALIMKTTLTFRKNAVDFQKPNEALVTCRSNVLHKRLVNAMGR